MARANWLLDLGTAHMDSGGGGSAKFTVRNSNHRHVPIFLCFPFALLACSWLMTTAFLVTAWPFFIIAKSRQRSHRRFQVVVAHQQRRKPDVLLWTVLQQVVKRLVVRKRKLKVLRPRPAVRLGVHGTARPVRKHVHRRASA